jgi:signal transduction histidine kinase
MTADDLHPVEPASSFCHLVHDLKNQLSILLVWAEAVRSAVPEGKAALDIESLLNAAGRAAKLTDEILVAATIGAHPRVTPHAPLDLNAVIRANLGTIRRLAGARISVRLRLSPGGAMVAAEIIQIERILLNLVLNACEAMPDGGSMLVETSVVSSVPTDAGEPTPAGIRLTVTDMGRGMCPEVIERIFEPLFTTKPGGTGFGLNSVAHTVRALRGSIAVESGVERGTMVSITLPLVTPD